MKLRLVTVAFAVGLIGVALPPVSAAADGGGVSVVGTVNGRALTQIDGNAPLRVQPDSTLVFDLTLTNRGSSPVKVPRIRFDGRVLKLAFFTYKVQVGLEVPAAGSVHATFEVATDGLGAQATGLLPGHLTLLSATGSELGSTAVALDVRGQARSIYGMFALAVLVLTAVMLGGLLFRLATRRLPPSRWSRAWRFALPGGGLGLASVVTASYLRVLVPSDRWSWSLLLGGFVVGFAVGYLTPEQGDDGDPEALYEDEVVSVPRAVDLRDRVVDVRAPDQPLSVATLFGPDERD